MKQGSMDSQSMQLLDVVTLLEDLPERKLFRGQVGTVVAVYEPNVFEVEFVDNTGRTYGLETIRAEQLMQLHHCALNA
jgi:hypothetical protein